MALSAKELLREVLKGNTTEGCIFGRASENVPANSLVYLNNMDSAHPTFALASAASFDTLFPLFVCVEGCLSGKFTSLRPRGLLTGINTTGAVSSAVYLSDTPGLYSFTPGTNTVIVGKVLVVNATLGQLVLSPQIMPLTAPASSVFTSIVYAEGSLEVEDNLYTTWLDTYNAILSVAPGTQIQCAVHDVAGVTALTGLLLELDGVTFVSRYAGVRSTLILGTGVSIASLPVFGPGIDVNVTSNAVDQQIFEANNVTAKLILDDATLINSGGNWPAFDAINGGILLTTLRNGSSIGNAGNPVLGTRAPGDIQQISLFGHSTLDTNTLTDSGTGFGSFSVFDGDGTNSISHTQSAATDVTYVDRVEIEQVNCSIRNVSAAAFQTHTDALINCDASGGDFTVTVLQPSLWPRNVLFIKKGVGGTVTIDLPGPGPLNIDGALTYPMSNDNQGVILHSDGINTIRVLSVANTPTVGAAEQYVYVWQPGGVASGFTYTDWATLYAAANATTGEYVVEIDQYTALTDAHMPTGTWDVSRIHFRPVDNRICALYVDDGCVWSSGSLAGGLPASTTGIDLHFESLSTTAELNVADYSVFDIYWNLNNCTVSSTTTPGVVLNGTLLVVNAHNCTLIGAAKGVVATVDVNGAGGVTIDATGNTVTEPLFVQSTDADIGNSYQLNDNSPNAVPDISADIPGGASTLVVARRTAYTTAVPLDSAGTASYQVLISDEVINVSIATGVCTVVLPAVAQYANRTLIIKVTTATGPGAELQIDPGLDNIDGSSATIVGITTAYTCYHLHSDGVDWFIHALYP